MGLDILSISALSGQLAESLGRKNRLEREDEAASGQEAGRRGKRADEGLKPEQIHDPRRIDPEVIKGYHGLDLKHAWLLVEQTVPDILGSTPHKLAETQSLLENSYLTSAYI